ncbi:MAG: hypothetical protein VYE29_09095 [Pseudomonadota bacterium]|nr:hypothetical protein [Pseudomonadota bacterium]
MITRSLIKTISLILMLVLPSQALASGLLACEQHRDVAVLQSHAAAPHDSHLSSAASPDCHGQPPIIKSAGDESSDHAALELECRHCINSCQSKPGFDEHGAGRLTADHADATLNAGVSVTLPGYTNLPQRPPCL